jgi:hypothetical protein
LRAAFFVSIGIFTLVTMKSAQGISLKYIVILFFALFANYYFLFLSSFNIPEKIPFTQVKINGIIVFTIFMVVLNFLIRELIKLRQDFTVGYLTLYGTVVCFFSEVFFQAFLWRLFPEDGFYDFFIGVLANSIMCGVLSFFIAFQLKKRNTKRLLSFIIIFLIIFKLLTYFFPTLLQKH